MSTLLKVWIALVVLTLIAMWAGAVQESAIPILVQVAIVMAVSAVKAWTILEYFLGLHVAPRGWRVLFAIYLIALSGAMFAIYSAGTVLASRAHTVTGIIQ